MSTGRGGSVSRRDHNQAYRRPRSPHRRNQLRRSTHPKRQPLFGREREGGASLREAASLAASHRPPLSAGRGGSVSRRDHNQAARNRAHLAWAHKPGGKVKPIPSYSSGEGVRGRGASLREAASPPESPHVSPSRSSGEGAWGRGASLREAASPPESHSPACFIPRISSSLAVRPTPRSIARLPRRASMALMPMPPIISLISCVHAVTRLMSR